MTNIEQIKRKHPPLSELINILLKTGIDVARFYRTGNDQKHRLYLSHPCENDKYACFSKPPTRPYSIKFKKEKPGPGDTHDEIEPEEKFHSLEEVVGCPKLKEFFGTEKKSDTPQPINEKPLESKKMENKNAILYGPPGTGKTYATIEEALRILDTAYLDTNKEDRKALKKRFDELEKAGQVRFVTFHQSFSYEDFVEGLRANTTDDGTVKYEVEDGIFAKICRDATSGVIATDDPFRIALNKLQQMSEESTSPILMHTKQGKKFSIEYNGGNTFKVFPVGGLNENPKYFTNIEHVRRLYQTGDAGDAYNLSYVRGLLQFLKQDCDLPDYQPPDTDESNKRKYVLIIDEINRGNVSRIFGELITLIEPSKRAGADETLSVTLPYSKEKFTIPDNVYLIGTMNTADRSLTGIDIALRRRFSFKEVPPQPELLDDVIVEGINVGAMLRVMNQRIAVLLDRDHCLGHAYFMTLQRKEDQPAASLSELAEIFKQNILPLLQEYFFEDWQRIRWVLNDHRKDANHQFIIEDNALSVSDLFGDVAELAQSQRRWRLNPSAFQHAESYIGIGIACPETQALQGGEVA